MYVWNILNIEIISNTLFHAISEVTKKIQLELVVNIGSHNHMIISSDDSQIFIEKYLWPCVGRGIVYNTCSALES